jgi:hypothetical protein
MATFDPALNRLKDRMATLIADIIPGLEGNATAIYARIMPLASDNDLRIKLEAEYQQLSKELKLRSHELINIRHEIDNLELELHRPKR